MNLVLHPYFNDFAINDLWNKPIDYAKKDEIKELLEQ